MEVQSGQGNITNNWHEIPLAFIALDELDRDMFRGGILVTDSKGKPIEFRCTSAIQPNNVQKTLYGNTLRTHMSVDLTGLPLLSAVKEKPQVILINQEELLELRSVIHIPVFLITKQGTSLATVESDKSNKSELLTSASGKFEPVVVTSHWEYADDLSIVSQELTRLSSVLDFTEPFTRISNALKLIHDKGILSSK